MLPYCIAIISLIGVCAVVAWALIAADRTRP